MVDINKPPPAETIDSGATRRSILTDMAAVVAIATPGAGISDGRATGITPGLSCNPKDFGAVGDGKADDSAAFQRAFTNSTRTRRSNAYTIKGEYQAGVLIPPGRYRIASTITMPGTNILVAAQVPGTVEILLDDDTYFITAQALITTIAIDGIKITGGKGGYRSVYARANSAGMMLFNRCAFAGYTEAAISNEATDSPYLKVTNCSFFGREGTPAIGIAWGGYCDDLYIANNTFSQNAYHIKLGGDGCGLSGNWHIDLNSFMSFGDSTTLADIWLVPSYDTTGGGINSGHGASINYNKFGNENQKPGHPRMLVARENPAGASRATRTPLAGYDDGTDYAVTGVTVRGNRFSSISNPDAPILSSRISELRAWCWDDNFYDGGVYTYAVEFTGTRTVRYTNTSWTGRIGAGAIAAGRPFASGRFSNSPLGVFDDPLGVLQSDPQVPLAGGAKDDPTQAILMAAFDYADILVYAAATKSRFTGPYGGANGAEITCGARGGGAHIARVALPADSSGYIQCQLARGAQRSVDQVYVELYKDGLAFLIQKIVVLPEALTSISIPFRTGPALNDVYFRIRPAAYAAGSADTFRVAHMCINIGRAPANTAHLATAGDGGWDQPHIVLGAHHLWVDGTGRLRIKNAAPTSDTDGAIVATQG